MLKYQNISTSILEFLRRQIVSGKIQGGERLIENKLSIELGVSRPPLRETFRILQNESLVRTTPRIGTYVTELSSADFNQICDLRIMVECFAVQQLKNIGRKELPELEKIVEIQNAVQIPKNLLTMNKNTHCSGSLPIFTFSWSSLQATPISPTGTGDYPQTLHAISICFFSSPEPLPKI